MADAVRIFGVNLNISHIAAVPQTHLHPCLILNLSEKPDKGTSIVNDTIYREVAPESMQFVRAFPRIPQEIWEADPVQGPVRVSKLGVKDAYHRVPLQPSQVCTFTYVIPSAPGDEDYIIHIDLVPPMGWVDALSETLTDVASALVDTDLPVLSYCGIYKILATTPPPPHTHTH